MKYLDTEAVFLVCCAVVACFFITSFKGCLQLRNSQIIDCVKTGAKLEECSKAMR